LPAVCKAAAINWLPPLQPVKEPYFLGGIGGPQPFDCYRIDRQRKEACALRGTAALAASDLKLRRFTEQGSGSAACDNKTDGFCRSGGEFAAIAANNTRTSKKRRSHFFDTQKRRQPLGCRRFAVM
jgi:hypothetical protein